MTLENGSLGGSGGGSIVPGSLRVYSGLDELRAIPQANAASLENVFVQLQGSTSKIWRWDADSAAVDNGTTVITPDDSTGAGRWIADQTQGEIGYGQGITSDPLVYDNFLKDGVLNGQVAPTGQVWECQGAGGLTASVENATLSSGANVYCYVPNGPDAESAEPVINAAAVFSFNEQLDFGAQAAACVAFILDREGPSTGTTLANMLHCTISPTDFSLTKRQNSDPPPWTVLAGGSWEGQTDGTPYGIKIENMDVAAGEFDFVDPAGNRHHIVDADITDIDPKWLALQIINGAPGYWHGITSGRNLSEYKRALGMGAAKADVTYLQGSALSLWKQYSWALSGGVGWYTIARESIWGTYRLTGDFWLSTQNGVSAQLTKFHVDCTSSGSPTLTVENSVASGVGLICDQARLSWNSVTGAIQLDVHLNAAATASFDLSMEGVLLPFYQPTVGAVVQASGSQIFSLGASGGAEAVQHVAGAIAKNTLTSIFSLPVSSGTGVGLEVEITVYSAGAVAGYAGERSKWIFEGGVYAGAWVPGTLTKSNNSKWSVNAGVIDLEATLSFVYAAGVLTGKLEITVSGTNASPYSPVWGATISQSNSSPSAITAL